MKVPALLLSIEMVEVQRSKKARLSSGLRKRERRQIQPCTQFFNAFHHSSFKNPGAAPEDAHRQREGPVLSS